jgi:Gpi18-like mannosyltransferase
LLYLIARFFPDTPVVAAVKLPSLIADFVMAYFVYRIVQIKYPKGLIPISAGMAVLFAPTVVLNSGFWGQADSLFTAGLVACLFFLLVEKQGLAMLAFGIALAFKLQAIFIAPLLFALLLRKAIPWRFFLIIPAILALALIPAWIAGRPIPDLLNIYLFQTSQFELLTMNAPSLYAWLPSTKQVFNLFYIPGVIFGGIAAYCLFLIALKAPEKLKREAIVELTLLSMVLIPFSLPKMHERYFYPADVISIAFAFYYPQLYYIPILIGGVSFFAYEPYLFNVEQIPMPILTAALLITICILTYNTMKRLYRPELPPRSNPPIEPDSPAAADQTAEEA